MMSRLLVFFLALPFTAGFNIRTPVSSSPAVARSLPSLTPLFHFKRRSLGQNTDDAGESPLWRRVLDRFDTTTAAGIKDAKGAGPLKRVKGLHGPITYLVLAFMAGLKWRWCFRNPYYWFAVAFCVKWYRARYVFKIPVWDRQPNWNNIITSKEQEKDLKAFTCTQCGSTLFIAKTREFFFEGNTGIGGLGCFSCGAKGKENFVMDRDRIVEDVADVDDYFEYERPLDFVSRAERRNLLKEAGGDEEKANLLLVGRSGSESGDDSTSDSTVNGDTDVPSTESLEGAQESDQDEDGDVEPSPKAEAETPTEDDEVEDTKASVRESEAGPEKPVLPKKEVKPKKKKKKSASKKSKSTPDETASLDDFDALDMDSL
jgi:hypothetical protein